MVRIRPAERRDIDVLLDLWEALMACGHEADPRFRQAANGREPMRTFMHACFDAGSPFPPFLLAEAEHHPVGFIRGFPLNIVPVVEQAPSVRIGDLYVAPAWRRQGVARRLVDGLLERAARNGYRRAEVGTLTNDARAVSFWRSLGFGDWQVTLSREP